MSETSWSSVVALGRLHGFSLRCDRLTVLLETSQDDGALAPAGLALRLLAGCARPASGTVRALGVDPARDASVRRRIALLGDDVLLGPIAPDAGVARRELEETVRAIAEARGVPVPDASASRRAIADELANDGNAALVLVAFPERYVDDREALFARVRAALGRGAQVVIATRELDQVLALAPDERAVGAIVARGTVVAVAPAHALPWATPWEGSVTRVVRVVVDGAAEAGAVPPSSRLASQLLADPEVAPHVASVEPVSANELRLHVRAPRAVAKAIARRARDGVEVRALSVLGASAAEILGGLR